MPARRPGISRSHGRLGWSSDRGFSQAGVQPSPQQEPLPVRVHHPAIQASHDRWFRVIRVSRDGDKLHIENIGEFPLYVTAALFSQTEIGHARVLDGNRVVSLNGQPIESREVGR